MAFARRTGETKGGTCGYCGAAVTLEAVETLDGRAGLHWGPSPHRAPCGAHCLAGSVAHGETDVHIDPYGECPRCGAKAAEVASTVENAEGTERSVLQRYVVGRYSGRYPFGTPSALPDVRCEARLEYSQGLYRYEAELLWFQENWAPPLDEALLAYLAKASWFDLSTKYEI